MVSCCSLFVALLVAFCFAIVAAPPVVVAKAPATQIECEKAGKTWRPQTGTCKDVGGSKLSAIEKAIGMLGLACAILALWLLWRSSEERWEK